MLVPRVQTTRGSSPFFTHFCDDRVEIKVGHSLSILSLYREREGKGDPRLWILEYGFEGKSALGNRCLFLRIVGSEARVAFCTVVRIVDDFDTVHKCTKNAGVLL